MTQSGPVLDRSTWEGQSVVGILELGSLLSGSAGVVMDRGSWIKLHLILWF
ncbi:hypothetical protein HanRHA438_Chr13g0610571 [Helianthus annuus]|nr:hypothetical protein HanRHA438_Chr13g0610571 [Helianthus annuus]